MRIIKKKHNDSDIDNISDSCVADFFGFQRTFARKVFGVWVHFAFRFSYLRLCCFLILRKLYCHFFVAKQAIDISRKWAICVGYIALTVLFMPFSFMVDKLQNTEGNTNDIGIMLLGWPSIFAFAVLLAPFPYIYHDLQQQKIRWVFVIEMAQILELAITFACYLVFVAFGDMFRTFIEEHLYIDIILITILLIVTFLPLILQATKQKTSDWSVVDKIQYGYVTQTRI